MSNSVTSKFTGLFRGLFRRTDEPESAPAHLPAARPVTAAAPAAQESAPTPAPSVVAAKPSADEISLPVIPIIAHLPMELRAKLMNVPAPGATVTLPVDTVVSQLAFGAVKITFGEFRQMVPGLFASTGTDLDVKMITLPLNEILSRLNPSILARSSARKVEVDEEIKGPFAGHGRGVTFTSEPLKSSPLKPAVSKPAADTEFMPLKPRLEAPLPISPLTPPSAPIHFAPLPATPPLAPARPPLNPLPANGSNGHHAPPPAAPKLPSTPPPAPITFKVSAAPAPVPPTPPPAVVPALPVPAEPAQPTIFAALWDLAEIWPEEVKNEILTGSLANENVPLPGNFIESGLKKGRVTMHWKQLRTLAKPSSAPSINDGLELELPLKVVAPLFFAAKKTLSAPRKKQTVSEQIPNLFFGFPQSAPEPPAAPSPAPVEKKSADSNFYVWGDTNDMPQMDAPGFGAPAVPHTDFTSRQATPKDLVARAIALPGIAGVLVALPDGLRVASEVPAEFNADTLAAFVPQIYERMNQSAKELRMGLLNNVSFTVGNVPWRIYRVNAVYLAAFGRAGESLPAAQLAALAGELDRKK